MSKLYFKTLDMIDERIAKLEKEVRDIKQSEWERGSYIKRLKSRHTKQANLVRKVLALRNIKTPDWTQLKKLLKRTKHFLHYADRFSKDKNNRYLVYFTLTEKAKLKNMLHRMTPKIRIGKYRPLYLTPSQKRKLGRILRLYSVNKYV